jgi:RNA polymerase sigma-70 factor (ECF subfamily)
VLAVIYLVFNEGYSASAGDELIRHELCDEAIRLGRILCELMPDEPEAAGLLALMLLQDSRKAARVDSAGEQVLLEDQDRSLWNRPQITEGLAILEEALKRHMPGVYQVQAAIAAVHCESEDTETTDWQQIIALYDALNALQPSPVIQLNRAVAVAMGQDLQTGLDIVDGLTSDQRMDQYLFLHSTRADLLRRLGRPHESAIAYRRALELADNVPDRNFLEKRLREVTGAD